MTTLRSEFDKTRDELHTLLDEVRVKIHLGGMDAKEMLAEITRDAQKLARQAGQTSREATRELLLRTRALADTLKH